jgi:hypothetical protein
MSVLKNAAAHFLVVAIGALSLGTTACSSATTSINVLDARTDARHPPTHMGLPLRTGQIVFTEAPGSYSFVFSLIPDKFYPFTHAAILSVEDGQPYVYDISGRYKPNFHSRVLDNVKGGMRRTPFAQYVSPNLYAEVYDPPTGIDGEKAAAFARAKFAEGPDFDAFFDYSDHTKLFCTELLQLSLEAGGAPHRTLGGVNPNPSIRASMEWLGVPLNTSLPAGSFIEGARYVGALGQFSSRTSAYAYFEAKRELYRRFKMDQRLGYIFVLTGMGDIEAKPQVEDFANRAGHLFDKVEPLPPPDDPRIAKAVRQLADQMFGPVPD